MINNNRVKYKLHYSQYYDFILGDGDYIQRNLNPVIYVNTCSGLTSTVAWSGATQNQTVLENITLTGFDNFYISDPVQYNDGDINTNYTKTIPNDYKFTFHSVSGHSEQITTGFTGHTIYDIVATGDDVCTMDLEGGFYQGFYKLHEYPVKLLPDRMVKGWTMNTIIKFPNTINVTGQTLNDFYPENSGFIFYMGTRAENKFSNINSTEVNTITENYQIDEIEAWYNQFVNDDNEAYYDFFGGLSGTTTVNLNNYGSDDKSSFFPHPLYTDGGELRLNGEEYVGYYTIEDGQYFSGRRKTDDSEVLTFDSTLTESASFDNNFGVRINSDGKIGYKVLRTATYDPCIEDYMESGVTITNGVAYYVEEKYSKFPIFNDSNNGHIFVSVVFERDVVLDTKCLRKYSDFRNGTLTIYVNGRPVLREKNFTEIIPKKLDTIKEFQEGVPFNLSWGGGTQGLMESVTFGGSDYSDRGRLLEQNFAGTWGGGVNEFEFYIEPLHFTDIRKKFYEKQSIYNLKGNFGGRTTIVTRG